MTRRPLTILLVLAAVAALDLDTRAECAEPAKKARVLFVTQSAGFKHGSVTRNGQELSAAEVAMTQLGQQTGLFDVHCTQDCAADFTRENLQNYDIVMFYTTLDLPIDKEDLDYFLNDWLKQKGHGFLGFHSATDTFHNHRPYWEMIGGTFNGHPWGSSKTVTITVHDTDHPGTRVYGQEFQIKDEIYQYKNWQPENVRVLMSLNMEKCDPRKPYHVAVSWCKEWGEGRMFYTNLGHNETTWTDKRFLKSTEGAVRWLMGLENADAKPNPDVSKAEEDKAAAAAGESK